MPQTAKTYPPRFIEKILVAKRAKVSNDQIRADFMLTKHELKGIIATALASGKYNRDKRGETTFLKVNQILQTKILEMKENHNLTNDEISVKLGLSKGQVMGFVSRALMNGTYTSKRKAYQGTARAVTELTEKEKIDAQKSSNRLQAQLELDELRAKRQDTTLIRKYQGFKLFSTKGFWLFQN